MNVKRGDLAIRNARIFTIDPLQPLAEALVVRDGRIVNLGAWEHVKDSSGDVQVFNLDGNVVLPGFIDSHVHLGWTGLDKMGVSFYETETVEDVQEILAQAVIDTPLGEQILGMGLNHYLFPDHKLPESTDLDAVTPDHPVMLLGVTGHYALANSKCLRELDLPPDISGLDESGLLRDRANTLAGREIRARFAREQGLGRVYGAAADLAASVGLTTVHALDGEDTADDEEIRALIAMEPELPVRVVIWFQTTHVEVVRNLGLPRVGGCILLDGDFGPHTAALMDPYIDQPDNRGTLYYTQEQVDQFVETAHLAGMQIAMHAVGDRAAEQALGSYEKVLDKWPRADHRHRIEHFSIFNERLVELTRRLGVHLAIQPPFDSYFGGHTRLNRILGEERAKRTDPLRSLIEAGIPVGGGSDSTVTPMKPLYGVYSAVNHSNPRERVDIERALQLYTIDNAVLAFEEQDKGSLEIGKLGDMVVLGQDPTQVSVDKIADIPVEMTVVGGEVVYSRAVD
jgi:predicted amidohydrolase YtcJ